MILDLSWLLTTASLIILGYAFYTWLRGQLPRRESVKNTAPRRAFKLRSRGSARSQGSEPMNVGSGHQDAAEPPVQVQPVQPAITPAAPAGAPGTVVDDGFTLSTRELVQLGEALNLYRDGRTIEQAVCTAFGVTKGGSEGWKRAKALFDGATVPPSAAPTGTYTALSPVKRSRRRVAR